MVNSGSWDLSSDKWQRNDFLEKQLSIDGGVINWSKSRIKLWQSKENFSENTANKILEIATSTLASIQATPQGQVRREKLETLFSNLACYSAILREQHIKEATQSSTELQKVLDIIAVELPHPLIAKLYSGDIRESFAELSSETSSLENLAGARSMLKEDAKTITTRFNQLQIILRQGAMQPDLQMRFEELIGEEKKIKQNVEELKTIDAQIKEIETKQQALAPETWLQKLGNIIGFKSPHRKLKDSLETPIKQYVKIHNDIVTSSKKVDQLLTHFNLPTESTAINWDNIVTDGSEPVTETQRKKMIQALVQIMVPDAEKSDFNNNRSSASLLQAQLELLIPSADVLKSISFNEEQSSLTIVLKESSIGKIPDLDVSGTNKALQQATVVPTPSITINLDQEKKVLSINDMNWKFDNQHSGYRGMLNSALGFAFLSRQHQYKMQLPVIIKSLEFKKEKEGYALTGNVHADGSPDKINTLSTPMSKIDPDVLKKVIINWESKK